VNEEALVHRGLLCQIKKDRRINREHGGIILDGDTNARRKPARISL